MSNTINVRSLDPHDKSWLRHEAQRRGVSMDALARQIIHERRERAQRHASPADAFKRHFGPEHGVELPPRMRYRGQLGAPIWISSPLKKTRTEDAEQVKK